MTGHVTCACRALRCVQEVAALCMQQAGDTRSPLHDFTAPAPALAPAAAAAAGGEHADASTLPHKLAHLLRKCLPFSVAPEQTMFCSSRAGAQEPDIASCVSDGTSGSGVGSVSSSSARGSSTAPAPMAVKRRAATACTPGQGGDRHGSETVHGMPSSKMTSWQPKRRSSCQMVRPWVQAPPAWAMMLPIVIVSISVRPPTRPRARVPPAVRCGGWMVAGCTYARAAARCATAARSARRGTGRRWGTSWRARSWRRSGGRAGRLEVVLQLIRAAN